MTDTAVAKQNGTSPGAFVAGLPAEQYVPPAPPGFNSWAEKLFDLALKRRVNEANADVIADDCAVIFADEEHPFTQHVIDAMDLAVCYAIMERAKRDAFERLIATYGGAE